MKTQMCLRQQDQYDQQGLLKREVCQGLKNVEVTPTTSLPPRTGPGAPSACLPPPPWPPPQHANGMGLPPLGGVLPPSPPLPPTISLPPSPSPRLIQSMTSPLRHSHQSASHSHQSASHSQSPQPTNHSISRSHTVHGSPNHHAMSDSSPSISVCPKRQQTMTEPWSEYASPTESGLELLVSESLVSSASQADACGSSIRGSSNCSSPCLRSHSTCDTGHTELKDGRDFVGVMSDRLVDGMSDRLACPEVRVATSH